jgi:hypothetical protein
VEGPEIDAAGWVATSAAVSTALGSLGTWLYLSRSNRRLLQAQAGKMDAEGESAGIASAVELIQEMRAERQELRKMLVAAEEKAAVTREEREALWAEKRLLQMDLEARERSIRYLRRYLEDAGIKVPPETPPA